MFELPSATAPTVEVQSPKNARDVQGQRYQQPVASGEAGRPGLDQLRDQRGQPRIDTPIEPGKRMRRVAVALQEGGRPEQSRISIVLISPAEDLAGEHHGDEFLEAVGLACRNNEIVRRSSCSMRHMASTYLGALPQSRFTWMAPICMRSLYPEAIRHAACTTLRVTNLIGIKRKPLDRIGRSKAAYDLPQVFRTKSCLRDGLLGRGLHAQGAVYG